MGVLNPHVTMEAVKIGEFCQELSAKDADQVTTWRRKERSKCNWLMQQVTQSRKRAREPVKIVYKFELKRRAFVEGLVHQSNKAGGYIYNGTLCEQYPYGHTVFCPQKDEKKCNPSSMENLTINKHHHHVEPSPTNKS